MVKLVVLLARLWAPWVIVASSLCGIITVAIQRGYFSENVSDEQLVNAEYQKELELMWNSK